VILAYHRIVRAPGEVAFDSGVYSATESAFDAQVQFLARHFEVVGPEALESEPGTPGRKVVLTFDDGYRDNYELALPILRRHGVPAAFFLATGFLDRPAVPWWDELAWIAKTSPKPSIDAGDWLVRDLPLTGDRRHAIAELARVYKSLPTDVAEDFVEHCAEAAGTGRCDPGLAREMWMTWQMAAELRDAGMTVGGHTETHPILARSDPDRQRREIEGCAARLRDELDVKMRFFAYPVGLRASFDEVTKRILADSGVRLAFSLYGGYRRRGDHDPFDVPRASIGLGMRQQDFRAIFLAPAAFARW
jgi:peptidoglycan/xylan/chitin deacetylase (PgdA/CDA1 family)